MEGANHNKRSRQQDQVDPMDAFLNQVSVISKFIEGCDSCCKKYEG